MVHQDADVIVVGAGPGGSACAYHLASHGVEVLLLEKAEFPREKVCGDGLTPRAAKQLIAMGVPTTGAGWARNRGLRVVGGGVRLELDWPDLSSFPSYGLTRTRLDFDDLLARRAVAAGAKLRTGTTVIGPVIDERTERVIGVEATEGGDPQPRTLRAPLIVAADGVSGRFPLALGLVKRDDRPLGVAVRRYYHSPRHADDYLESWVELHAGGDRDRLLPGYGWIFGMGDGRVNVGLGVLNSSSGFGRHNFRRMLSDWMAATPPEWGMSDEANADGPVLGAALPMAFNRVPHYTRGVMLVGDSGGMVNPFNGEGIAYAMEAGVLAAEVAVQALAEPDLGRRERTLRSYPALLSDRYGGYYRLGSWFVKLIGRPEIIRFGIRHGLSRPTLMRFLVKLMSNLTEPRGGDAMDRVINAMARLAPAV